MGAKPDINRSTAGVLFPKDISSQIWAKTLETSAIMQLATKTSMPTNGQTFQTIVGEPEAKWVGETAKKPVSKHTFGNRSVMPYKMAVIEPFSMEFVRDKRALYDQCVNRLPFALSKLFDTTILGTTAPGENFDVLGDCDKVSIAANQYDTFVDIDAAIGSADGMLSGIALGPKGRSLLLKAKDNQGNPLFTPGVESGTLGNILGAPVSVKKQVHVADTPNIVGIAGDFSDAFYAIADGIKFSVSDVATITIDGAAVNLWEQNMVAVRVEAEFGFYVKNKAEFKLLTDQA